MGIGVSIFLITLGAILRFAISADLIGKSVNIHTIGVILMLVGGVSALPQIILISRCRPPADHSPRYTGAVPWSTVGFEPTSTRLQGGRCAVELRALGPRKATRKQKAAHRAASVGSDPYPEAPSGSSAASRLITGLPSVRGLLLGRAGRL